MAHCFLTGVRLRMEQAFVLNRREAKDLLATLNDRVASLRRVIDQLAPLDDSGPSAQNAHRAHHGLAPKQHRFVCKAVADAIAPGFAEIELFRAWPVYQAEVRAVASRGLRAHPVHGEAIRAFDEQAVREGDKLGRAVLRLLDPQGKLGRQTRITICAAACVQPRDQSPEQVAKLMKDAAMGFGNAGGLGLTQADLVGLRLLIDAPQPAERPAAINTAASNQK